MDLMPTIEAKSDQIIADDLLAGPRTIKVTRVSANEGNGEQPVNVYFEGDGGKPFRPCKSMRRVMVKVWGADSSKYAGKAMTIFRDPKVKWGGMEVGGIRIAEMSDIKEPVVMALTESRKARKPYTVKPLDLAKLDDGDAAKDAADKIIANIGRAPSLDKLNTYIGGKPSTHIEAWREARPELAEAVKTALKNKRSEFAPADEENPFGDDE